MLFRSSKIPKQRSTGQKLQCWRISSTPAGQEKGQTQAQIGGSLRNRPSPDWWSVPSVKCIRQPTRAEPMERSTPTKILRLAPDSVFVSFLCPFFITYFKLLPGISLLLPPFFSQAFGGLLRIVRTHLMCYSHSLYLGASLTEAYLYGLHAQHMCHTSACTF